MNRLTLVIALLTFCGQVRAGDPADRNTPGGTYTPPPGSAVLPGDTIFLTPDPTKLHRFGADGRAM